MQTVLNYHGTMISGVLHSVKRFWRMLDTIITLRCDFVRQGLWRKMVNLLENVWVFHPIRRFSLKRWNGFRLVSARNMQASKKLCGVRLPFTLNFLQKQWFKVPRELWEPKVFWGQFWLGLNFWVQDWPKKVPLRWANCMYVFLSRIFFRLQNWPKKVPHSGGRK